MSSSSDELKPVRQNGRPRKHRDPLNLPDTIDIPLDGNPAQAVLPCSPERQANLLDWYKDEVVSVNRQLGLYDKFPMVCKGQHCFWAELCPTKDAGFLYKGFRCPIQIMEIHRQFVLLVHELDVSPDDTVDLNHVADLVRIDLQIKTIDMDLQVRGMVVDTVAGIAQKEGIPIYQLGENLMLARQSKLRADRDRIYKQLLISREAKKKIELQTKATENSATDILSRIKMAVMAQNGELGGHLAGISGSGSGKGYATIDQPQPKALPAELSDLDDDEEFGEGEAPDEDLF